MRRRAAFPLLAFLVACAPALGGAHHPEDAERAARRADVTAMLAHAAANWNRGDLDAFVDDYLPGSATTFIGSRGVLRGPTAIRGAYAARFAPGGVRDSLSFEVIDVDALAPDVLNAIATYTLSRRVGARDSVTARGPTSLVMRRVDGRWRIVHDHSS
jgi:beta-aspartyl-peptidase (threonine type)